MVNNNTIILKNKLLEFKEKYKLLSFVAVYDNKIDFYFVHILNEHHYHNNEQYYDDMFDLNQELFKDLNTYDILISDNDTFMKLNENQLLFKL